MPYDADNPKRTSPDFLDYWTKKSEIDQLVVNQDAVYDAIDADHSATTGEHAVADIGNVVDGWVDTAFGNVAVTNSVNDNAQQNIVTGLTARTDPELMTPATVANTLPQIATDVWGGIAQCKGATASGGEAEAAWQMTGAANPSMQHRIIRRAAGGVAGDFTPLSVGTAKMGFRIGAYVGVSAAESPLVAARNMILAAGAPVAKNHIDRPWQNGAAIKAALEARHDGSYLSDLITMEEMYRGALYATGTTAITRSNEFTTATLAAHGGNMMCIVPWGAGFSTAAVHCILPAWDDTNMYVVAWIAPGLSTASSDSIYMGGTVFDLAVAPDASFTGSFDGTFTVAQGDATDLDIYESKLDKNDEIIYKLFLARHRMNGLHARSVDEFTGYRVVKNNTTETISGTIGVATAVTLEAWPATNPIYLVAIKGAAGSGIAAITIGGDETNSKVYIRRVTSGSSNSFTLRVIAIDRV